MDPAPTQYIDRDGAALAYQVIGDGPVDIVHFSEFTQHLDLMWTDPDIHHNFEHASQIRAERLLPAARDSAFPIRFRTSRPSSSRPTT